MFRRIEFILPGLPDDQESYPPFKGGLMLAGSDEVVDEFGDGVILDIEQPDESIEAWWFDVEDAVRSATPNPSGRAE